MDVTHLVFINSTLIFIVSLKKRDLYRIYILHMSLNCCVHIIIQRPLISYPA